MIGAAPIPWMPSGERAESLELWSPGNPLFTPPEFIIQVDEPPAGKTLKDILNG